MSTYGAVAEIVYSTPERRTRFLMGFENRNLRREMEVAALRPTAGLSERQQALWAARADAVLIAGVAW